MLACGGRAADVVARLQPLMFRRWSRSAERGFSSRGPRCRSNSCCLTPAQPVMVLLRRIHLLVRVIENDIQSFTLHPFCNANAQAQFEILKMSYSVPISQTF